MNLEETLLECQKILDNGDNSMYHGWFTLSISKYGTPVAWAVKNPPESFDLTYARTMTQLHWGDSLLEAAQLLLEDLQNWEKEGKPYDVWDETKDKNVKLRIELEEENMLLRNLLQRTAVERETPQEVWDYLERLK